MKKITLVSLSLALGLFAALPLAHSAPKKADPAVIMSCMQKGIMDAGLLYEFKEDGTFDITATNGWGPSTKVDTNVAFSIFPGTATSEDGSMSEKVGILMNETGTYFMAAFTEGAQKDANDATKMSFDLYVVQAPYLAPGSTVIPGVDFACTTSVDTFAKMFPF